MYQMSLTHFFFKANLVKGFSVQNTEKWVDS
jgi:hypothetical protein